MDQQETLEWKRRENEIRRLQEERIQLLKDALIQRDKDRRIIK